MDRPDAQEVRSYLMDLQDRICGYLEEQDGQARFVRPEFPDPSGGISRPRILEDGPVLERSAVSFTHSRGQSLPAAATAQRPALAGSPFEAASLSLIVHPRNPYAPTTHANFRFFLATPADAPPVWWFGGGFDLTPYYGFAEDAVHWHRAAAAACGEQEVYRRLKQACDAYFFLPHRGEPRGIGGLFFDDWAEGGFDASFAFLRRVADAFLPAYGPLLERRKSLPYGERQRWFQLYRRGRYVEFNLLYDRGTRYGLQSGRRIESVLGSMPPLARWSYDFQPEEGSEEAALLEFLKPRDWLADS